MSNTKQVSTINTNLLSLRDLYTEAVKDIDGHDGNRELEAFRRGVVEGIRRTTYRLYGTEGEYVVVRGSN